MNDREVYTKHEGPWSNVPDRSWALTRLHDGRPSVWTRCPGCHGTGSLRNHDVKADGNVEPSVLCGCGYHAFIRLDGWDHGDLPAREGA